MDWLLDMILFLKVKEQGSIGGENMNLSIRKLA